MEEWVETSQKSCLIKNRAEGQIILVQFKSIVQGDNSYRIVKSL